MAVKIMLRLPKCGNRRLLLTMLVVTMVTTLLLYCQDERVVHYHTTLNVLARNEIRKVGLGGTDVACTFPKVDPFNPVAMSYYQKFPTTSCQDGQPTITYYDGEFVRVNFTRKALHVGDTPISCWYRSVSYQRKLLFRNGAWEGPFSDSIAATDSPEFVEVKCQDQHGRVVSRIHHYAIKRNSNKTEQKATGLLTFKNSQMNVLLIGIDSLSANLFKRSMPKTRKYMMETLGAVEMNMYNKIGDNTFPNLLAIMSGKYENDMSGWNQAQGFDDVPFIWQDYKLAGYQTQYLSDRHDFNDFKEQPTDSYNLPMVEAMMKNKIPFDNNCFEDQEEVKLWLNLVFEFARNKVGKRGRFFSLAMMKRPTHDFPNQASAVDEHYRNFLRMMFKSSLLNNTFMVFFGDHGIRVGPYRGTFEGSIEERAANMVLYLPHWFRHQYPSLYKNVLTNANRLTTNFDIHETLRSIVNFNGTINPPTIDRRGITLLSEVPPQRTCTHASVSPHFCLCHGGISVTDSDIQVQVGQKLVEKINSILKNHREICEVLSLQKVNELILLAGKVGRNAVYRVMITTDPGGAEFEATVDYTLYYFLFSSVNVADLISRINLYRGQSDCVKNDKLIRMYCFCKTLQ